MKTVKFTKEPGYVFDLFSLFGYYFSSLRTPELLSNHNKSDEDAEHILRLLSDYGPFSNELLPFFYNKESNTCFMAQYYFQPYKAIFGSGFCLSTVLEALRDHDQVIENLIRFYFEGVTADTIAECKRSPIAAGRLIKASNYSGDVKSGLFAFFLEPAAVIQQLSCELMAKDFALSQSYEKAFHELMELQGNFDLVSVFSDFAESGSGIKNLETFDSVSVSFCRCAHRTIALWFYESSIVIMLGTKYAETFKALKERQQLPALDVFGNIMSEKNRIEILNLIVRKEEVSIRDIEQILGFSGTNAYYHLMLMNKANMLKTRNKGRIVLYSINKDYFRSVCDLLEKYADDPSNNNA